MGLHLPSGNWRLGFSLSFACAILWGVLPLALSATLEVLDVYSITWFRFTLSFILLAFYLSAKQQFPQPLTFCKSQWKLLVVATVFLAINYLLFVEGLAETTPANSQVLIQLAPVALGLGGLIIFKETYNRIQWGSLSLLTCGITLFFHEQLKIFVLSADKYLFGSSLLLIAAISWAIYALAQKQLLHQLSSPQIMVLIYAGCSLLFAPMTSFSQLVTLSPLNWIILLFCALNTLIGYGAFAESLEHWPASKVSAVLSLTPLFTLISIFIAVRLFPNAFSEQGITVWGVLGAIFVVCGSVGIALGNQHHSTQ